MEVVFWISILVIFYTYVGYAIVLYILVKLRGKKNAPPDEYDLPEATLVVAAYNEEQIIQEKISNSIQLKYPPGKLKIIFVTDGSTDRTPDIIRNTPQVQLMHSPERLGKIHAINRAMQQVNSEVVFFTDANTILNEEALVLMARHYTQSDIGAVSGEKRVHIADSSDATAGEGFYWKYESALKKWDAQLYSVVGAAGELFSIRTKLFEEVPVDTILDDFIISLRIAGKGYRVAYEPSAYAVELPSESIKEELKRKVRIAAGGWQSVIRMPGLLNPFHNPVLTFQYISHRVLRWTITPVLLVLVLTLNITLVVQNDRKLYLMLLILQLAFYGAAVTGYLMERMQIKVKAFFVPYYFSMMNYAVLAGAVRYFRGKQNAVWEKARRKE